MDFIKKVVAEQGYPPSVREIADAIGFASPSTVQYHLRALEKAGQIVRDPTKPRALSITQSPDSLAPEKGDEPVLLVPLLGDVAAGVGVLAEEHFENTFAVPSDLIGSQSGKLFALKVRGDSMVDIGIFEDDVVVVGAQRTAKHGDIVVALINGGQDGTVKVYEDRDGVPKLRARNSTYSEERSTIYFSDERDGVIGKVLGLMRTY